MTDVRESVVTFDQTGLKGINSVSESRSKTLIYHIRRTCILYWTTDPSVFLVTDSQIWRCESTLTMGMCGVASGVVDSYDVVRVLYVFGLLITGSSISVSNTYTHT